MKFFNYPGWQQGEYKALNEFMSKTGQSLGYIGYTRYHEQVAVKIL